MTQYETYLEYANKILRIREAIVNGTLFQDHAFTRVGFPNGKYDIRFDHNGGVGITTIAHLENRVGKENDPSFAGSERIFYNSENNIYNLRGDGSDYHQYIPTAPDEEWYFQASLIYSDEVLRGDIIIKTLAAHPMPGFKQFIITPILLDKIISRMDQAGI